MNATYTTRNEAIEREIIAALGEMAAEHDIEAIAGEVLTTVGEGATYRWTLAVDAEDFWASVERNAR